MVTKLNSANQVAEIVTAENSSAIADAIQYLKRANYSEVSLVDEEVITNTSFHYSSPVNVAGYREKTFIYTSTLNQPTYVQIEGCRNISFDTVDMFTVGSAITVNVSTTEYTTLSDEIPYVRVRYNNSTASNGSGSFSAWLEIATY